MTYKAMLLPEDLWCGDFARDQAETVTVFESDRAPVATGLVDASGTPIYRLPDTVQFGFVK